MKKIILCADDYALTPAVSYGIRKAVNANRLSATSCMTLSPFWPKEGEVLKSITADKKLSVGIHFTLTDLKPITKMPKFSSYSGSSYGRLSKTTNHNKMPTIASVIKGAFLGNLPLDEIRNELENQLQSFVDVYGALPNHIDGHQHVHILPGIRDIILDLYQKYYPNKEALVRNCCNSMFSMFFNRRSKLKALYIGLLSRKLKNNLIKHKIPTNEIFSGIYDFNLFKNKSGNEEFGGYRAIFNNFLANINIDGSNNGVYPLIMCHPGLADSELARLDSVTYQREIELEYLLSSAFIEDLTKFGFRLSS